jgi:hypothetical protein
MATLVGVCIDLKKLHAEETLAESAYTCYKSVCAGSGLPQLPWGQFFETLTVLSAERLIEVTVKLIPRLATVACVACTQDEVQFALSDNPDYGRFLSHAE